jgi:hypothetical protein
LQRADAQHFLGARHAVPAERVACTNADTLLPL